MVLWSGGFCVNRFAVGEIRHLERFHFGVAASCRATSACIVYRAHIFLKFLCTIKCKNPPINKRLIESSFSILQHNAKAGSRPGDRAQERLRVPAVGIGPWKQPWEGQSVKHRGLPLLLPLWAQVGDLQVPAAFG